MRSFNLAAALDNSILLVDETRAAALNTMLHDFQSRWPKAHDKLVAERTPMSASAEDYGWWGTEGSFLSILRPYVVRNGVLEIPVKGFLAHDFPYAFFGIVTGYDYIQRCIQRGLSDPEVQRISLIVDSPGGMVSGCFDLVDYIHNIRGQKPIAGFANELAASAACAVISACDPGSIYLTRTSYIGSVGVVTSHVDRSKQMEMNGIVVTFIFAGKHKVEGHGFAALPPEAKARIQADIDETYEIFVSTVARNRGLSADAVRETEADVFMGPAAVSSGLADKVMSFDDSLAEFSAHTPPVVGEGEPIMGDVTQADHDAAVATAQTEGAKAGATAERQRISAIVNHAEAASRPVTAKNLAMNTDMTVDAAVAFLAAQPIEATASTSGEGEGDDNADKPVNFNAAMDGTKNPEVGGGSPDGEGGEPKKASRAERAISAAGIGGRNKSK